MAKPVALVTGAGRKVGIAAGIARTLARNGWDLALTHWTPYDERMPWGVQPGDVEELNEELLSLGARVWSTSWNLEPPESATGLFDILRREADPISALILCHCESVDSGILDTDTLNLDRHFAVNVRSSLQLIHALRSRYRLRAAASLRSQAITPWEMCRMERPKLRLTG